MVSISPEDTGWGQTPFSVLPGSVNTVGVKDEGVPCVGLAEQHCLHACAGLTGGWADGSVLQLSSLGVLGFPRAQRRHLPPVPPGPRAGPGRPGPPGPGGGS